MLASVSRALVKREYFSLRIDLDADALWQRLLAHPRIREADDPAPDPPPPQGERFLVARESPHEIRLRHWAGPADAASPIVVLRLTPEAGATRIEGRFTWPPRRAPLVTGGTMNRRRRLGTVAAIASIVATIALMAPVAIGTGTIHVIALLLFFCVPTALVFVPGLLIWRSEVRKALVGPLWELVGEVFTPLALPESEGRQAPFRAALPAGPGGLAHTTSRGSV